MMKKILLCLFFLTSLGLRAQSVDSIQFIQTADTILVKTEKLLMEIESAGSIPQSAPSQAIDTLNVLEKTYAKEEAIVDSVNNIIATPGRNLEERVNKIESKTTDKYNDAASEVNDGLEGVGIEHSLKQGDLGAVPGQQKIDGMLPSSGDLTDKLQPENLDLEPLDEAGKVLQQAGQGLEQGKEIGAEVESIGKGDLRDTGKLSEMAEGQAGKHAAIQELDKQSAELNALNPSLADPKATAEDQIRNMVVTEATNHFAEQAAPLQKGMAKMSKYKRKYKEVQSFKNKQWVKRTSLADKSLTERLVPGLTFQVIDGHFLVIDFFPQLGYQLNTRWTAGIGGVYRTNIIKKQSEGKVKYDMAGLGMYTTFQVWKSFWLYAEADRNNVKLHIPSPAPGIPGTVTHQVEWELLLGIKKAHQFTRHVKGHAQVLVNALHDKETSPYLRPFHFRFGFEFGLKGKGK